MKGPQFRAEFWTLHRLVSDASVNERYCFIAVLLTFFSSLGVLSAGLVFVAGRADATHMSTSTWLGYLTMANQLLVAYAWSIFAAKMLTQCGEILDNAVVILKVSLVFQQSYNIRKRP